MNLNLSKVDYSDKEFIKNVGVYTLKVVDVRTDSSKNGKELLVIDFVNKDNLHFEQRFTVQNSTLAIIKRFMDTLEIDTTKSFNTDECIGKYIKATLDFEPYNGKKYLKCKKWEVSQANTQATTTNQDDYNDDPIPF
jgi:hypothetical protein